MAFNAQYQGRLIYCAIAWEVLESQFGVKIHSREEAEVVFLANKPTIEEWAKQLILAGRVSPDDRVMIE